MILERRNAYFCKSCRRITLTVDIDPGVTPMFISCPHCNETASSFMYQIPGCMRFDFSSGTASILPADFEWYKPDAKELKTLLKSDKQHVKSGGLLLRKRTEAEALTFELKRPE